MYYNGAEEVRIMLVILKQVVVLFLFALIGCVLVRKKMVNADHSGLLSALAVHVFLPCTAFNAFSSNFTVEYLTQKYPLVLVSAVILIVVIIMGKIIAKKLQPTGYDRAVYEYSLIIANGSYVGYPLMIGLYGTAYLLDMMLFAIPLTIYTYTLGYDLLTEQTGQKITLKRLLTPVVVAMILGCVVGLSGVVVPSVITQVTESAAACLGPAGMLLLGIALARFNPRELLAHKQVYIVTAMRLVIIPVAIFAVLKLLHLDFAILPAILSYAMPCGLNVIVFPKMIGHDCTRGAALVLISMVLSLVTIPLCLYFMV